MWRVPGDVENRNTHTVVYYHSMHDRFGDSIEGKLEDEQASERHNCYAVPVSKLLYRQF